MSRLYEFNVDVFGVPSDRTGSVTLAVQEEISDTAEVETEKKEDQTYDMFFSGDTLLCGGEGDEEAHARVKAAVQKIVPGAKVVSRWRCLEDLPWDNVYGEEAT